MGKMRTRMSAVRGTAAQVHNSVMNQKLRRVGMHVLFVRLDAAAWPSACEARAAAKSGWLWRVGGGW